MSARVIEIGNVVDTGNWASPQRGRIYSPDGICPCLNCMQGGGLEPKILLYEENRSVEHDIGRLPQDHLF